MNISFIQPSRDNLKYLKWSYASIRKNLDNKEHEICVADDFSSDGTESWCKEMSKSDPHFKFIRNNGPTRLGHTILYDRLINDVATNDVVMIWHADMYACPDLDLHIEKHIKRGVVVSLTRIEPPLHPVGVEKITAGFGQEPEDFNEETFLSWFKSTVTSYKDKTTEGIFAPWAIYKEDFQSIGGHDSLFAPQSKEDSDIFNRFLLNGYKFVQTWEGCVYHMTCRGSRFNPTLTEVGKESQEWLKQNNRSTRNFIRKWGHFVKHNEYMKPVVPKLYKVGFVIHNINDQLLSALEPWCGTLYSDADCTRYIESEQPTTKFDLRSRLKKTTERREDDVIVEFDAREFGNAQFDFISNLSDIITDTGELGSFEFSIFKIKINSLVSRDHLLINL